MPQSLSFFKSRFSDRWNHIAVGTTGDRVKMIDVSASIMEAILSYMYTGTVTNIEESAYQLLPAAEELLYGSVNLGRMSEETLTKALTNNSAVDVFIHADAHNALDLKKECMDFIFSNITSVKQSEEWDKLREEEMHQDLWMELLENIAEKHATTNTTCTRIHTNKLEEEEAKEQELAYLDSFDF